MEHLQVLAIEVDVFEKFKLLTVWLNCGNKRDFEAILHYLDLYRDHPIHELNVETSDKKLYDANTWI